MKTIEQLESQLQTWIPRRPSARLRAGIFGPPAAEPRLRWGGAWATLASAGALALVIATRQIPLTTATEAHTSPALLAAAMSNQDLAAYAGSQGERGWNLPAVSFRWTNPGDSFYATSFPSQENSNR